MTPDEQETLAAALLAMMGDLVTYSPQGRVIRVADVLRLVADLSSGLIAQGVDPHLILAAAVAPTEGKPTSS